MQKALDTELKCFNCGKIFYRKISSILSRPKSYRTHCSRKCANKTRSVFEVITDDLSVEEIIKKVSCLKIITKEDLEGLKRKVLCNKDADEKDRWHKIYYYNEAISDVIAMIENGGGEQCGRVAYAEGDGEKSHPKPDTDLKTTASVGSNPTSVSTPLPKKSCEHNYCKVTSPNVVGGEMGEICIKCWQFNEKSCETCRFDEFYKLNKGCLIFCNEKNKWQPKEDKKEKKPELPKELPELPKEFEIIHYQEPKDQSPIYLAINDLINWAKWAEKKLEGK